MDAIRRYAKPTLRRPRALLAFEGWNDASDGASGVAAYLLGQHDVTEPFATIEPEEFYDFQDRRPIVSIDDGGTRSLTWPRTHLYAIRLPADERDLVGIRTNYRHEDVYLYRLRVPARKARALLLDYIKTINALTLTPRWYNAFTHNCTTTIQQHADNIAAGRPWNWRLLANGHLPELGYLHGSINTSRPFAEINQKSHINQRAVAAGITPAYSIKIREDLPQRPGRN